MPHQQDTALWRWDAVDIARAVRLGRVSAREVAEAALARQAEANGAINAVVLPLEREALEAADAVDAARARGEALGPLAGVPVTTKINADQRGLPTSNGVAAFRDVVAVEDSPVVANLRRAGAVIIGRTNTPAFSWRWFTDNALHGRTLNPWDAGVTPGGSSGGSAAAVAADLCLAATGTDTGGSIRQPAAFTGIVGIKPTYGRVSRWGIIAFASSLDQAGPMTKDVRDAAIMLRAMSGHDPKDSTSADLPVPDFEAMLTGDIRGKRIGIPREYRVDGMPPEIDALWHKGAEMLRDAGAEIVDISLPHTKYALPAYYVIAPAEASSNLARYDGVRYGRRARLGQGDGIVEMYEKTRAEGFGPEVQRRVMIGTYVLSAGFYDAYYTQAQKVRALVARDFENAWESCDLLLTPTAPSSAFALGEKSADPIAMYLNDVFTVPSSLAGLPAMSVPGGLDAGGLPLGLQVIGKPLDEQGVLSLQFMIEVDGCRVSFVDFRFVPLIDEEGGEHRGGGSGGETEDEE